MKSKRKLSHPLIAERLKQLRKHLGYSKHKMASRLELNTDSYARYENDTRTPSFATLSRMVEEWGISMDWLYFNRGPMLFQEGVGSKIDSLENDNLELRENLNQLQQQLESSQSQLKNKETETELTKKLQVVEQDLANRPDMPPEIKELVEEMAQSQLLTYEILAHFHRFKSGGTTQ